MRSLPASSKAGAARAKETRGPPWASDWSMQEISPESPEARRKRFAKARAKFGHQVGKVRPGTYPFEVMKRVAIGVYNDGFIHAGNLAYLALLTIFPFVIVAAAVARLLGQQSTEGMDAVVGL